MSIDYSQGRYRVFDTNGIAIGTIDEDEFVRKDSRLIYRIDGAEVYTLNGDLLAFIDENIAMTPNDRKFLAFSRSNGLCICNGV